MTSTNGPLEPPAHVRQAAAELRAWYVGLIDQGFSDDQAMFLLGQVITAQIISGD